MLIDSQLQSQAKDDYLPLSRLTSGEDVAAFLLANKCKGEPCQDGSCPIAQWFLRKGWRYVTVCNGHIYLGMAHTVEVELKMTVAVAEFVERLDKGAFKELVAA